MPVIKKEGAFYSFGILLGADLAALIIFGHCLERIYLGYPGENHPNSVNEKGSGDNKS